MRTKVRVNSFKKWRKWGKTITSVLVTIAFLFTNIIPLLSIPFMFPTEKAYAAANVPLALKLDNFNDTSQLQLNGKSSTTLYNEVNVLRLTEAIVGEKASTYTKNQVSLANNKSFSTYFKFRISGAYNPWGTGGGDGFSFTLQRAGNSVCGTSNPALASDGTAPSVSIEFDTYEDGSVPRHIGINTNGSSTSLAQINTPFNIWDGNEYHVWIDYDGINNQMEVRIEQNSDIRPAVANLTKTSLDLDAILGGDEVYAGFTAATGSAYEAHDILKWYFINDYSPIDLINNTYLDTSNLTLTANPASDTNLSTITATVTDIAGNPVPNVPVTFTTDLGTLSQTIASTDALGQVVLTLDAGSSNGTASVKAVAQGGAYSTVNVGLVGDPDLLAVTEDTAALEIAFCGTDTASSVTQALGVLPSAGANGTTITWVSDTPLVLSNDGQTVNRPAYTDGDAVVTLAAIISKGSATETKEFALTVKALAMSDAEAVMEDTAALVITYGTGDSASNVTQNVTLPTSGANGTSVSWSSTNNTVIGTNGTVTPPSYTEGDATVTLTASISKGSASDTKVFNLTVKALAMSDAEAVAEAKTALAITYGAGDSASNVTQDVTLPTGGANGTSISWSSSNTTVIGTNGTVTPPSYTDGDAALTLTATISKGSASDTKVFNLTVKALAMSDAEAVAEAKTALAITYGAGDSASKVTQNVTLPTGGANGTSISWSSNNTTVLANNGIVNRPSYTDGDTTVTLTATVSKGSATETKVFSLTVKALAMSDAESVAADKASLVITFNGSDTAGSVTRNLTLPRTGANGTTVAWSSNNSRFVNYWGQVTRPDRSTGNIKVTLTATIYKGWAVDRKYFVITIMADQIVPTIKSTIPGDGGSNIARAEPITVKFSEPIKFGDRAKDIKVNAVKITYRYYVIPTEKRISIPRGLHISGDTLTITHPLLETYTKYEVVLPRDSVRDMSGNYLNPPSTMYDGQIINAKTFWFRTGKHTEPPVIVSRYPADGATGVALNVPITVTFDEPVKLGAVSNTVTLKDSVGNTLPITLKAEGKTLTIKPGRLLENATKYQVRLPIGSVLTTSDKDLASPYSFEFTTGRFQVASQPEDGETNVGINKVFVVKYDSTTQPGPNINGVTVTDQEDNNVPVSVMVNDGILLINPDKNLEFATEYTVRVPSGALTAADGTVNGEYVFDFTTTEEITDILPGFEYSPVAVIEGDSIDFNATSVFDQVGKDYQREIIAYSWNFGDGDSDSGSTTKHSYNSPGNYTVTLNMTDDKGQSYTLTNEVVVRSIGEVNLVVSPEGTTKYRYYDPEWYEFLSTFGPEFTVTLDSDGIPLPGRQIMVYKGDSLIYDVSTEYNGKRTIEISQDKLDFGNNLLTFVSYGETVQRMVRYTEGATSTYKIKLTNSTEIQGLKFWVDGQEKNPTYADGFYNFGTLPTGVHQIKITAPYYYDKEYIVDLNRNEQTQTVEMEPNEPSDRPVVRWVTSDYSDSRKGRKDFIKGISVPVNLTAKVDWKGHKPGYVKFVTPDRTYKEADGIRYLDLGSYIRVGGTVSVVAVSAFGTESAAVDAGIRIVPRPPVGSVKFNKSTKEFEFSMNSSMPSAKSPDAPSSLPFFAGNSLGLDSDHFKLSGGMTNNGKLVFNIAAGGAKDKTKKRLLKAPKKEYKVEVGGVEIEGFLGAEFTYAYRQDIKQWAFEGGSVTVQVNGSATKKQYFLIPGVFIPGYVRGTIGLNTETGLDISKNFVTNETEYQGMVLIGPNAEIAIGAGGGEFYVEGYLNGEVDFIYTFPVNEVSVEAELNGGVRAQAWIFSWEDNMLHYEWEYPEEPSKSGMRSLAFRPAGLPEAADFKLSSREYLKTESGWLESGGNIRALSPGPENAELVSVAPNNILLMNVGGEETLIGDLSSETLQNSIFPCPDPIMINNGSDTVIAWVADNPARTAMNRTEIKLARYDGTVWSAPEFMNLDGTGDFSPQLAKTSNGIMAVWENVYQALPESANLMNMSAGMEIAAALSDNGLTGWSNFTGLTENNYLDHAPVVVASGDNAILLWTANRSDNLTGSAAEPNEIMFSKWDGVSWREPETVLSGLGAVTYTTAAFNGNEGIFAYILDGDDDTGTIEDQELYAITYDGTGWSGPVKLTDNGVQDANPQITYMDNQMMLTWYQDGKIVYSKGLQGTPEIISGITGANADFKIASKDGRLTVVYNRPAARGQNIYTSIYDAAVDTWSYPVQLTGEDGFLNSAMGPVFDGAGNLMVAHSKVELVTNVINGVEYTNPGQAGLGMVTFKPRHDLAVDSLGIKFSENNPVPGSTVTITADIKNDGDFSEQDVEVEFYNGDPVAGGTKIGETHVIADVIPARGSVPVSVSWTVPTSSGPHSIYVVVDPEEKSQDSSRINNRAYTQAVAPDIEISGLKYESLGGTQYLITADITNVGSMDVGSGEITLYEGENDNTRVATQQVAALESGDQTQAVFIWDAVGKEFTNDKFRLSTRLNPPAGVSEYTEENNLFQLALTRETLYAKSFSPAENSRTAPVDQGITITFNTDIQEGPTFGEVVLLDEAGTDVPVSKAIEGAVLTIAPSQPLTHEKTYTFILKVGDVKGVNGSDLESEFILDFTTDAEHINPVVKSTYPAGEMADTPLDADVNIVFNEDVTAGADYNSVRLTDAYGWNINVQRQINGSTLVLNPTANLKYGMDYTVTVPGGAVVNGAGLPLEEEYSFTFATLPDPNLESPSGSGSSLPNPAQSEVISTGLVTEDGLKVVIVSTQLPERAASIREAASALGTELLADPVEFKVEAVQSDGNRKPLLVFDEYVDRKITLTGQVDPANSTGVIYNTNTGQFVPVPTLFTTVDGKTVATIKHKGSGIYTVISTQKTFADIQRHWAKKDVEVLASKLIVSGKGTNKYEPQGKVTRAEFATLLVRALGLTGSSGSGGSAGSAGFTDVSNEWYAEAVNKAAEAGLIQGYKNGTFKPNATITRQEMAAMVRKAVEVAGFVVEVEDSDKLVGEFGDKAEIKDWAKEAVAAAVQAGIVKGNAKGEFKPEADATRAEAAVMLLKTLGYVGFVNELNR